MMSRVPVAVCVTEENYHATLKGLHVLVIDDDDDSRFLMETMLGSYGAIVTAVESAKRAREALVQVRPHVIVSDLAMPEVDGPTLLRELRADRNYASVPALAVTAYGHQYLAAELRAAGFTAVLRKPLSPDEFARAVTAVQAAQGPRRRRPPTPPANG